MTVAFIYVGEELKGTLVTTSYFIERNIPL